MADLSQDQSLKPNPTTNPPGDNQPSQNQDVQIPTPPTEQPTSTPSTSDSSFPPIKEEEKFATPKQEEIKKELSELGISPKGSSKKTRVLLATLGVLFLIATLPAAVYLVKQRQEIKTEASVGTLEHCTLPNCTVTVGPDYLSFVANGHGTKTTKTPTVNLNIPTGSTVFKAFAIWGGERNADKPKDRNFNLSINNQAAQPVTAEAEFNTYVEQYNSAPEVFLADITSLIPTNTTQFNFRITGGFLDGSYGSDGGGGAGYGVAYIVVYKNPANSYNKLVIKLWGEFVFRNLSTNMDFNIHDRKTGSDKLRMAFFFGEGEGSMVGDSRPNYLYYNEANNQQLNPTDGTAFPAWGTDPSDWWDTRITGDDLPKISALSNTATFHTYSPNRPDEPNGLLGDSIVWVGGVVEYEVEPPTYGCWDECSTQSNCDLAGYICAIPTGDTSQTKRCLNPQCPSEETCVCTPPLCTSLTASPSAETLGESDEVQFICKGTAGTDDSIDRIEFKVQVNDEWQTPVAADNITELDGEYEGKINYTIPKAGDYQVQCRVCTTNEQMTCDDQGCASSATIKCTEWGKAAVEGS
ncbi:MAG TPA: hypothetical protein VMY36_02575 [Patescibacteria group bacterium]|nr:hypothetical protein [Patescibacteria group bacterium]